MKLLNNNTETHLIEEVEALRNRIEELEQSETNLKQAEIALKESEEKLRAIFDSVADGIVETDLSGNIVKVNKAILRIYGSDSEEDFIGKSALKFFAPFEEMRALKAYRNTYYKSVVEDSEFEALKTDGTSFPVQITSSVLRNVDGNPIGFVGVVKDITERKLAEEKLKISEESYHGIIDNAIGAIYILDTRGRFIDVNKGAIEMYGYPKQYFIGKTPKSLSARGKNDWKKINEHIRKAFMGVSQQFEFWAVKSNGEFFPKLIRLQKGRYFGKDVVIIFALDITERKQAEEKTQKHLNELLTLYESSLAFSQLISPEAVGKSIVDTLEKLMNWQRGSIWTISDSGENLNLFAHSSMGMSPEEFNKELDRVKGLVHRPGEGISGWVAFHGKPVRVGNVELDPRYIPGNPAVRSEMCVPLKIADRMIGSINVESTKPDAFSEFDERLLSTLANQAAIAVENSRLYEALQQELTERRQAEEALRESESQFRELWKATVEGIVILDKGIILEVNDAMCRMFEITREKAIGKSLFDFAPVETLNQIRERIVSGSEEPIEIPALRPDGGRIIFEIFAKQTIFRGMLRRMVVTRDITERKQAEKMLRESEERFRRLAENSPDIIYTHRLPPNPGFEYISPAITKISGYTPEEYYNDPELGFKIIHPDDKPELENLLKGKFYDSPHISRWIHKDGKIVWIEDKHSPVYDIEGNLVAVEGVARDITERKKAERTLIESEEKFRNLAENSPNMIFINQNGKIVYANKGCEDLMGYTRDEFYSSDFDFRKLIEPEYLKPLMANFKSHMEGQEVPPDEYGLRTKSDQRIESIINTRLITYGGVSAILGIVTDITERKIAEEAIKESEKLLKESQRVSQLGSYVFYITKGIWTSSDILDEIFGIDKNYDRTLESWFRLIHPEDQNEILEYITNKVLREHEPFKRDYRIIKLNSGEERWLNGLGELEFDTEGNPIKMIGTIQDITDRKLAQSRAIGLAHILESSLNEIYIFDAKTLRFIEVNRGARKNIGYSHDELKNLTPLDIKPEFTRESFENLITPLRTGEKHIINFETTHKRKNGSLYPVDVHLQLTTLEDKSVFLAIILDITARKHAEEALQESQAKWRSITENSPDQIMMLDNDANILFLNRTGYALIEEEVVGKSVYNFVPSAFHRRARECFENVLSSGKPGSYETEHGNKDGETQYFSVRVGPVYRGGQITALVCSSTDITRQKRIEEKLKESYVRLQSLAGRLQMIREEERASVAREIHDDLGQSLTALKMDISWIKNNPEMNEKEKYNKFNIMLDLINSTIQTVKRIATQLRPGILDDLGLVSAIEWQADEFQKRFNVKCNFAVNKKEGVVNDEIGIAVFRICQETLTNIARHSGATAVDINLNFGDDDLLVMEISDNGVGIDEEQVRSPQSFGLFGMRERVNILKGEMEVTGEHEKGTTVRVSIPVSKEDAGGNK